MPVIACLGWGSLVWRPGKLQIELPWREDGPRVQVEFLRQSKDNSITLVLDPSAAHVPAMWARMKLADLDEAAEDLRIRENIPEDYPQNIGRWSIGEPPPALIEDLPRWAEERGVDAVLWTALGGKFKGSRTKFPPVADIIAYLDNLPEEERKTAEMYVRYAPPQVGTAFRHEIADKLGWAAQAAPAVEGAQMEKETKDKGERADNESAAFASMPEFIADVIAKARAQDGADGGLLDILEKHIVCPEASSTALDEALSAIDALAESRATKGGTDGGPHHD